MELSSNHIFYTASPDVAEIAKPLRKLGITYFSYLKSESNGARTYLYSDASFLASYLEGKYYLVGNSESKPNNYKEQAILWSSLPNQHIYDDLVRPRNVDHGMFMFQPQPDFCEAFTFATNSGNSGIINTYLSNMDVLKTFTKYFKDKAAPIIKNADRHKIILPFNNGKLDFIDSSTDVNSLRNCFYLSTSSTRKMLTNRQIECCVLLLSGKTASEIAEILRLSTRTVEYYINNIKSKLDCKNKAELILKLSRLLRL